MVSYNATNSSWLKISAIVVLLITGINFAAAQKPEQEKAEVLRGEAQNWIQVGNSQFKKGLYQEAEKSFLAAKEYQEYLSADENRKLQKNLDKAHQASVGRQPVLERLQQARDLLSQGQPVKARAEYEKVRNSPYLTEKERKQISSELKIIDAGFDKQRKEITDLYNRSVEYYRAGELEKARDGFSEVVKSGLLVTTKGQTAEDYLVQIDSILIERLKGKSPEKPTSMATAQPSPPLAASKRPSQAAPQEIAESAPTQSNQQPAAQQEEIQKQTQPTQQETKEVEAAAETSPEKKPETGKAEEARANIIRTYTKAVVDDSAVRVEKYIGKREFGRALDSVRAAAEIVGENRPVIGEDAFVRYTARLKQLTERVVQARKKS